MRSYTQYIVSGACRVPMVFIYGQSSISVSFGGPIGWPLPMPCGEGDRGCPDVVDPYVKDRAARSTD